MSDANATPVETQPVVASPAPSEQLPGTQAPATPPKPTKTPRKPRTRGVPAAPAALAGANTVAVASAAAANAGGPVAGLAVAGGMVVGAAALGLRRRSKVRVQNRRRAARDLARRNGMSPGPSAVRSGKWTGSGGSSPRTRSGGGGSGPTRSKSVKPLGLGGGSGRHRSGSDPRSGKTGSGSDLKSKKTRSGPKKTRPGSDSPRSRRLDRKKRTPALFSSPDRPSLLRKAVGPRPKKGPRSNRGGLINRGDGSRRQPIQAVSNGAKALRRAATRVADGGRRIKQGAQAAYNGTRKAWNSRPAKAARRWTIGASRRAWGIIGPAVGSVLAGVHAALRRRGWRGIWQAMSTTWGRLRGKWGPKNGKHAKAAATPPAPVVPATVVARPKHAVAAPGGPAVLTGGVSAVQARIIEMSREMVGAAMMYTPEGMMDIGNDFSSFPEVIRNVANAIQGMTRQVQAGETPMNPAIVDSLKALHASLLKSAHQAEDLKPAFQNLHAVDIKRIRNPRPGEEMWDLSKNRDYVGR